MCKQIDSYAEKGTWQLTSATGYFSFHYPLSYLSLPSFPHPGKCFPPPPSTAASASAAAAAICEMVGLSVILEDHKDLPHENIRSPKIISKGSMIKPPSNPSSPTTPSSPGGFSRRKSPSNFSYSCGFLEYCFLCKQKLKPGKDIYMYKGDKAFCSEDCRYRQIFMDEEEGAAAKSGCTIEYNCSLAATSSSPPSSSSSSSSASSARGGKRGGGNRAFAY